MTFLVPTLTTKWAPYCKNLKNRRLQLGLTRYFPRSRKVATDADINARVDANGNFEEAEKTAAINIGNDASMVRVL